MRVELPLVDPIFSTYHFHGAGSAIISENSSIRNWYLNESVILSCETDFLKNRNSPELNIVNCCIHENPCLDKYWINLRFMNAKDLNTFIRRILNQGYYAHLWGVDDYYLPGKTWYRERHFCHDLLIYGYDSDEKTYLVYAYNQNWVYTTFEIPIKDCNRARASMIKQNIYGNMWVMKPNSEVIIFEPKTAINNIKQYLNNTCNNASAKTNEVYGIQVQNYLVKYMDKLIDGSIAYEHMDRRIFRLIWEHKKVMQERLRKIEEELNLNHSCSVAYDSIVAVADAARMLYATHLIKRRDSLLPIIQSKLESIMEQEEKILSNFVKHTERKL